jgi:SAM-dependent methyltransferase
LQHVNCNLCGADDFTVVFPKGFAQVHRIVRCNHCGLMYANPQELVDCDTIAAGSWPDSLDGVGQYVEKQNVQLPDNERALQVLNDLFPKRGKLLEIGSFLGVFLDRIRADGWTVTGVEPWRAPADYSRSRFGLNVLDGVLPNESLRDGEFDAVVMLHVIEHMPDPVAGLREIRRIMRSGGVLAIETPRFDSLMFKLLGHRERSIHNCGGHIFFFTRTHLQQLLQKAGFEVLRTDLVGRTLTLDRLLYNVALITRSQAVMNAMASLGRALRLNRFRLHINVRDMQRMYARAR